MDILLNSHVRLPQSGHPTNETVAHVATDPHCQMHTNQATEIQSPGKTRQKQRMPSTKQFWLIIMMDLPDTSLDHDQPSMNPRGIEINLQHPSSELASGVGWGGGWMGWVVRSQSAQLLNVVQRVCRCSLKAVSFSLRANLTRAYHIVGSRGTPWFCISSAHLPRIVLGANCGQTHRKSLRARLFISSV